MKHRIVAGGWYTKARWLTALHTFAWRVALFIVPDPALAIYAIACPDLVLEAISA